MIKEDVIRVYALENAIAHNGKAVAGAVLKPLFNEGLEKSKIKDVMPLIQKVLKKVNSMSLEKQKQEFEKVKGAVKKREVRVGLPDLPNAIVGGVVMRLAPFPSGPLHIGNARPYILNDEYVKKYNGKLFFVMDDTISGETKPVESEAYKLIPEGFDWLGIDYEKKIIYKSDRLEIYYKYAEELIKKGYMYVCSCSQEEFQELKKKGVECSCRHLPVEEHLERWTKMFSASQGEFAVRLKTSMQDPDPAFRDRVMFKVSDRNHPRVGKKYKVWPSLDFSWAIDDHLLEITHIIRGVDLMMETKVEKFIWDIFKWKHPEVIHTGFLKIEGLKLSKTKGAREVRSGEYIGWNDPRLWSLQSLRDRGFRPETLREFVLNMGVTKVNSITAIDILYSINRKFLEKVPRYFFVPEPVKIHIKGAPELEAELPLHPSEKIGSRKYNTCQEFYISKKDFDLMKSENYRLMHALNFKTHNILTTTPMHFSFLSKDPDKELNAKALQWVVADEKNKSKNFNVIVRMPDGSVVEGIGEASLSKLKKGDVVQFERFGFVSLYDLDKQNNKAEFWFCHR